MLMNKESKRDLLSRATDGHFLFPGSIEKIEIFLTDFYQVQSVEKKIFE